MNLAAPAAKGSLFYHTLDAWRGVGVVWIVMAHASLLAISTQFPDLANHPVCVFSLYARIALASFFVISGYCIANAAAIARQKPRSVFYFVRARVRRVYPPYLIVSLFAVVLSLAMALAVHFGWFRDSVIARLDFFHHDFWYYFSAVTLTQLPLGQTPILIVFWTLCYEVTWYAMVALVLWFTLRAKTVNALFNTLHILTITCLIWIALVPIPCPYPFDLWPEFGFGVLVYHILSDPGRVSAKVNLAVCVVLVVIYYLIAHDHSFIGRPTPPERFLFVGAYAVALILLFRVDEKLSSFRIIRGFAGIGVFSYSIYLTHLLTLGILSQVGKKLGITEATFWWLFVFEIAICLAVGRIFFIFFERPFLNSRRYTRARVPVAESAPAPTTG